MELRGRRARCRSLLSAFFTSARTRCSLSLVLVALFSFQISRFYLSAQMNPVLCPHHHPAPVMGTAMHSHHMTEAAPPSQEGCFYFQCCKETYFGLGLTPVQPLGSPVRVARPQQKSTGTPVLLEDRSFAETFLPPPFQPPRA